MPQLPRRIGDTMRSPYIVREKRFEKEVLEHLQKQYGDRARSKPCGGRDVDIGVLKQSAKPVPLGFKQPYQDIEIFIEVKGTKKPDGRPFTQKQNKSHLAVGLFQLMRRIRIQGQQGMLFLPYHQDFERFLTDARLTIKLTKLRIVFGYKGGSFTDWE